MLDLEIINTVTSVISALIGCFGTLGAFVGLYFVWRELKAVRRNQYATTSQNIVNSEREIWQIVLSDDAMVELSAHHLGMPKEVLDELGVTAKNALEMLLFFRQYENLYYQHIHDMLPPDTWEHWKRSMISTFGDERIRKLLLNSRMSYTRGFREFIQKEVIPQTSPLLEDQ